MKTMKKLASLILAMVMVIAMSIPTMAADPTYTLTINNSVDGHVYEAYQIFVARSLDEVDGKQVLSTVSWGESVSDTTALLNAIKAEGGLSVLHSATDAQTLATQLSTVTSDSVTIDLFAEVVSKYLNNPSGATSATAKAPYTITGLEPGYYLVKDKDASLEGAADVYTKLILRVLKDETVTPKGDAPKAEVTINDTLGGTYTNIKDFDINDTVYYKWSGSLPSNLKSYETYYYKFTDTLPEGIKFIDVQQVYLEGADSNVVHIFYDITDAATENDVMPAGFTADATGNVVTLEIDDLLARYSNILPSHKIVVKYTARVTRDAKIAEAMTNTLQVEYSNNPNEYKQDFAAQPTSKGLTVADVAHAFTFQVNVDKYDADVTTKKLNGAEFVLYYERIENEATVVYYAKAITDEMIQNNVLINNSPVIAEDKGIVYEWTTDLDEATVFETETAVVGGVTVDGYIGIKGLDQGVYYLKEMDPPSGYNLMESPVQIKIVPTYTENADNTADVTVSYEVDSIAQSSNTVGIRNSSGATLPVTGGIGTTIFYVVGAMLALAAVVLLVTKKRMEK